MRPPRGIAYSRRNHSYITALPQEDAVAEMLKRYEICRDMFHGFDWRLWTTGTAAQTRLVAKRSRTDLKAGGRKEALPQGCDNLASAFALAVPHEKALAIRDDVGFFQAVRSVLAKSDVQQKVPKIDLEHVIRQST